MDVAINCGLDLLNAFANVMKIVKNANGKVSRTLIAFGSNKNLDVQKQASKIIS